MNNNNFQQLLTKQHIILNSNQELTIEKVNAPSGSRFIDLSNISIKLSNNKTYNLLTSYLKNTITFTNQQIISIIQSLINDSEIKNNQTQQLTKQAHKFALENRAREGEIENTILVALKDKEEKAAKEAAKKGDK